jgi:hypothetical protein
MPGLHLRTKEVKGQYISSEFYYMYLIQRLKAGYQQDIDLFTCLRDSYEIIMLLICTLVTVSFQIYIDFPFYVHLLSSFVVLYLSMTFHRLSLT